MDGVWVSSQIVGESRFNVVQNETYQLLKARCHGHSSCSYEIVVDNQWQNWVSNKPALTLHFDNDQS